MTCNWKYEDLKDAIKGEQLPAMIVDLDCLDENISQISELVSGFNKKIRIASKSVRVPWLLKYIIEKGGSHFQGLMCFSVQEAEFLASQGFDDLLVAYPSVSKTDLELFHTLTQKGITITLMTFETQQITCLLEYLWQMYNGSRCVTRITWRLLKYKYI